MVKVHPDLGYVPFFRKGSAMRVLTPWLVRR